MNPIASAASTVSYPGDGTTKDFTFSFPYLDGAHVYAYVDDAPVAIALPVVNMARFATAPGVGALVEIRRQTPTDPLVAIPDGGVITDELLNINETQARYIAEEARDLAEPALRYNSALQAYNAKNRRIARVDDPDLLNDAVNLRSVKIEIARVLGGDPLAELIDDVTGLAADVENTRIYVEDKEAEFEAGVATVEALAAEASISPTGAQLVDRITAFLGSDAWTGGGVDVPVVTDKTRWRLRFRKSNLDGYLDFQEIEFRQAVGVAETNVTPTDGIYIGKDRTGASYDTSASLGFKHLCEYAFDGVITGTENFDVTTNAELAANEVFVGYYFTTPRTIREVALTASNASGSPYAPEDFDIDYSDDGIAWTTAVAVVDQVGWAPNETRTFLLPTTPPPGSENVYTYDTNGTFTRPPTGRVAYVQVWGAGGANRGGGGGYTEAFYRLRDLPTSVAIVVGTGVAASNGNNSSFGPLLTAYGGEVGGVSVGGRGGKALGFATPYTGEGLGGNASLTPTGGVYAGGGGNLSGKGADSVYGGGGGGTTGIGNSAYGGDGGNGTTAPTAPGGGGGTGQTGAAGRVKVTVF